VRLKAKALHELWLTIWPIAFMLVIAIGLGFYKRTLD